MSTRQWRCGALPVALAFAALAMVPAVHAQREARPVVAIVADANGTELTDLMIPRATLAGSGVARVVVVAAHAGRIALPPSSMTVEPDQTMAAFDAAHPAGADYVIVPALVDHANPP